MSGGSGGGGGFESYLPIAAALAATVMTDGAASPWLVETMGSEAAAGAVMGAGAGSIAGGGVAALTGQNVGQNALMGGLAGATLGYGGIGAGEAGGMGSLETGAESTVNPGFITAGAEPEVGMSTSQQLQSQMMAQDLENGANAGIGTSSTNVGGGGGGLGSIGGAGKGLFGTNITGTQAMLGGLGMAALIGQDNKRYGTPASATTPYTGGNLSKFKYDPNQYTPDTVQPPNPVYQPNYSGYARPPGYADGGLMQGGPANVDFMGGDMYPQSQINHSQYAQSSQMPTGAQQVAASYEPETNPLTGEPVAKMAVGGQPRDARTELMTSRNEVEKYIAQLAQNPSAVMAKAQNGDYNAMLAINQSKGTPGMNYAGGGIANLGGYSDGGRMLKGPGDGMSDSIPASINGKRPARLADGEFVVPADVVSNIGNGSTDAGAKKLYNMMNKVRKARTGKQKQAPAINADKYLPA